MTLDLSDRTTNDVTIVDLDGKMNTSTSPDADAYLSQLIAGGSNKLLLNMMGVDYISSSGLRVVLATGKKLGDLGQLFVAVVQTRDRQGRRLWRYRTKG